MNDITVHCSNCYKRIIKPHNTEIKPSTIYIRVRNCGYSNSDYIESKKAYCLSCFNSREDLHYCSICHNKSKPNSDTVMSFCYLCKKFCCKDCTMRIFPVYLTKSQKRIDKCKVITFVCKTDFDKIKVLLQFTNKEENENKGYSSLWID